MWTKWTVPLSLLLIQLTINPIIIRALQCYYCGEAPQVGDGCIEGLEKRAYISRYRPNDMTYTSDTVNSTVCSSLKVTLSTHDHSWDYTDYYILYSGLSATWVDQHAKFTSNYFIPFGPHTFETFQKISRRTAQTCTTAQDLDYGTIRWKLCEKSNNFFLNGGKIQSYEFCVCHTDFCNRPRNYINITNVDIEAKVRELLANLERSSPSTSTNPTATISVHPPKVLETSLPPTIDLFGEQGEEPHGTKLEVKVEINEANYLARHLPLWLNLFLIILCQ